MNENEKRIFSANTKYYMATKQLRQLEEAVIDFDAKKITLKQNDDITITDYEFIVVASSENACPISEILFEENGSWQKIEPRDQNAFGHYDWQGAIEGNFWKADLSFNSKCGKIKFVYKNNMVDPIILEVDYKEADKKAYYQKVAKENREKLIQSMSFEIRTGYTLVNVFWKNATNNVKKTRLEFFLKKDTGAKKGNVSQLFLTFDFDENTFYKSLAGLAPAEYFCRISQFDENNDLIVCSDMKEFRPDNAIAICDNNPIEFY